MNPAEFYCARLFLDMTREELERTVGRGGETIKAWSEIPSREEHIVRRHLRDVGREAAFDHYIANGGAK